MFARKWGYDRTMCGRYSLDTDDGRLIKRFNLASAPAGIRPDYNVTPEQEMPAILLGGDGERRAELMRWGISRIVGKDVVRELINARADKIFGGFWRKTVCSRRCLIPATSFFEWQKTADGKRPFLIRPRDEELFAFAGIWDIWRDSDGHEISSYAIITTESSGETRAVHDRMPVMLYREQEAEWLSPERDTPEALEGLLLPSADGRCEVYEVSPAVNNPRNNSPEVLLPV